MSYFHDCARSSSFTDAFGTAIIVRAARGCPKRTGAYWIKKLAGNRARDRKNIDKLEAAGWKTLVIWECTTNNEGDLNVRLRTFLKEQQ